MKSPTSQSENPRMSRPHPRSRTTKGRLMEKSKGNIYLGGSQGRPLLMDLGQLLVCRTCNLEEELNAEWRKQEQAGTH